MPLEYMLSCLNLISHFDKNIIPSYIISYDFNDSYMDLMLVWNKIESSYFANHIALKLNRNTINEILGAIKYTKYLISYSDDIIYKNCCMVTDPLSMKIGYLLRTF